MLSQEDCAILQTKAMLADGRIQTWKGIYKSEKKSHTKPWQSSSSYGENMILIGCRSPYCRPTGTNFKRNQPGEQVNSARKVWKHSNCCFGGDLLTRVWLCQIREFATLIMAGILITRLELFSCSRNRILQKFLDVVWSPILSKMLKSRLVFDKFL